MFRLIAILIALAPLDALAQNFNMVNPSGRPLGSSDYSRIPMHKAPSYRGLYDDRGRRIGTIEEKPGPLGTDYTLRDRRGTPRARSASPAK